METTNVSRFVHRFRNDLRFRNRINTIKLLPLGNTVDADVESVRDMERHEQLASHVFQNLLLQLDQSATAEDAREEAEPRASRPIRIPV